MIQCSNFKDDHWQVGYRCAPTTAYASSKRKMSSTFTDFALLYRKKSVKLEFSRHEHRRSTRQQPTP